ncbi:hypothetical protein HY640_01720 [Candidatus Woesearchaeota archaeon]|nr:hypothetical protein [Candidatus Woesearchaeota archaeon]
MSGRFLVMAAALAVVAAVFLVAAVFFRQGVVPSVGFGTEFSLKVNGSVMLEDGMVLSLLGVSEDSRCPSDVQCVWEGRVVMGFSASRGPFEEQFNLSFHGGRAQLRVIDNYVVEVRSVEPFPLSTRRIAVSDYVVRLSVLTV